MRTIIMTAILMNAFVGSAASANGTSATGAKEAKTVRERIALPSVDWPCWRGPQRSGISSEADWPASRFAAEPEVLWKASVGTGFSSLAVVEGRVYTMGNSNDVDSVFCMDVETGKVLWKHSYNCLLARLAYQGGPSATPAVDEGRVYTLSKSGHVFCLDAATGKVLWSKKFDAAPRQEGDYRNDWGYAASPLILGRKLILSIGWAGMALDKTNGKLIWDNGPGRPGYSSPVPFTMDGRQCLAMHVARGIVAVEAEGGKILWTIPWRTGWDQNASDVVVSDGKMFVSSGHRRGCALFDVAVDPPKEIWRNKAMSNDQSGFVLWNGYMYGVDNKQSLVCIDWQTGKSLWSGPTLGRGTLILVDGQLIVLGETGQLAIAKATSEGFSPIAELQIAQTGRYWTTPAFSGGRILVRNAAGDVVCIDVAISAGGVAGLKAVALRCEYLQDPLGIDETKPHLTWRVESNERGQKQTAYQVIIAGSEELLRADRGDLWNSGKVESDQTTFVKYVGKPLRSKMHCWWKVRCWDKDGRVSAWSQPGRWAIGLLDKAVVWKSLEDEIIVKKKEYLDTGIHGTYFLQKLLTESDRNNLFYEITSKKE